MKYSIYVGFDPRETAAFAVTRQSIRKHCNLPIPIYGLVLDRLKADGLYTRPMEMRPSAEKPVMWDVISDAPMATEFACSRFLVPHLAGSGWALFCDCDMLFRSDVAKLIQSLDKKYAVYCVKHDYKPQNAFKMDLQIQTQYNRKLWSSFCIFNADHPSNKALTVDLVNSAPGRDLHSFCWLKDEEIGELDESWNWVPGHSPGEIVPDCVHFSEGGPWFEGYENVPFSDEWKEHLNWWAR